MPLFSRTKTAVFCQFLDKCRDYHAELAKEREAQHFTFAELDENDAEFAKLRSWLPKIRARDFFAGSLGPAADKALAACEKDFAQFSRAIAETNERNLVPTRSRRQRSP